MKFGRWLVVGEHSRNARGRVRWNCVCECGVSRDVAEAGLAQGRSKSCGCLQRETITAQAKTHGLSDTWLHQKWRSMISRCTKKHDPSFQHYGGRGISVCDRWLNFVNFYEDNIAYEKSGLSLDRIDVNGNYTPDNCRWVTMKVQQNNRRSNALVEHNGESRTISEWADHLGVNYFTMWSRLREGVVSKEIALAHKDSLIAMVNRANGSRRASMRIEGSV